MTDRVKDSRWRALESRRMIDDARSLVSLAEGLRDWNPHRPERALGAPAASDDPMGAVLVHALSFDGSDLGRSPSRATSAAVAMPILVLLDDAPAVPAFLPEGDAADLPESTEEEVRGVIERRIREGLDRAPSEDHALDLVESIQDAVIGIDRRPAITYLNTSAVSLLQTLTGRTGPFVGDPLASAFPPAASATVRPAIQEALVHAGASRVEDPERCRGIALDVSVFPHPYGATLLVRDVTDRKQIEAELIEARLGWARAEARIRAMHDEAPR